MATKLQYTSEVFTPDTAYEALQHNELNRPISRKLIEKYARMMKSGLWHECPQPIVFNGKGGLIDGQHRLSAVVLAKVPIEFIVCRGATREHRKVLDAGRKRTPADVLRMEYQMSYASTVAACATWVQRLQTGVDHSMTSEEVVALVSSPKFKRGFEWIQKCEKTKRLTGAFYLGPLVWLTQRYRAEVIEFHRGVSTGSMLMPESPELKLRDAILTREVDTSYGIALKTVTAFAAFVDGEDTPKLYARKEAYERFRDEFKIPAKASQWMKTKALVKRRRKPDAFSR